MKQFFLSIVILLLTASCNSNSNETSNDAKVMAMEIPPPPPSTGSDTNYKDKKEVSEDKNTEPETIKPVVKEKKIIKDGTVSVKTNDIAASKKKY